MSFGSKYIICQRCINSNFYFCNALTSKFNFSMKKWKFRLNGTKNPKNISGICISSCIPCLFASFFGCKKCQNEFLVSVFINFLGNDFDKPLYNQSLSSTRFLKSWNIKFDNFKQNFTEFVGNGVIIRQTTKWCFYKIFTIWQVAMLLYCATLVFHWFFLFIKSGVIFGHYHFLIKIHYCLWL